MTTDHALMRLLLVLLVAIAAVGVVHAAELTIEPIDDKTVHEGDKLSFMIIGNDDDTPTLAYSGENLPDGAEVDPTTGEFNWTPAIDQAGYYEDVRLRVSNGTASNTTALNITVLDDTANHAPVVEPVANKVIDEEEKLLFPIVASDADGDEMTYGGVNLPEGAEINATTGEFTWTPAIGQAGIYENVRIRACDESDACDGTNLTITVMNTTASRGSVPFGSVTIKPETFNLASMGKLTAFITIGSQLFSGNFDIGSLFLGGAEPVKVKYSHKDGGTIIAKYDRQDVAEAARESNGKLFMNTTVDDGSEQTDINVSDTVRIIDKENQGKNREKNLETNQEQHGKGKGNSDSNGNGKGNKQ